MFIITQNNFGLQLNWSDDTNADPIDINLDSLDVTVCTNKTFDFYSCHKLDCELSNLFLQEQDVDLAQLKGEWYYVLFESCAFTNQIREDSFKTKCVEIKQASDTVSSDFLVPFEHLHCNELFVYVTKSQVIPIFSWLTTQQQLRAWKQLSMKCGQTQTTQLELGASQLSLTAF
ncbi:Hypothetical_protein [Hexamita inflata]|uniref:Hypothetical_protein n=1 Tax=Hexamita inflata TaxID=28002 RepID=A0AA86QE35_9EUKA|nr:Hypothetical protein HINF_LOCUS45244 [Hexamita inflata]